MARILILGRSGQVATALQARLPADGHEVEALGRDVLDLADPAAARAAVLARSPDVVINAAAYTAVDKAETDEAAARALNAAGPAAAAAAAAGVGAPFIHFSTDYVFDGSKGEPYREDDAPRPLGVYGRTKLEGEQAVAGANPRHVILRTAWVCSPVGSNFLKTMLRLAGERDELSVVDDQRGRPTFARDLADVVAGVLTMTAAPPADAWGVFHAVSGGETTWCGFAQAIMEGSAARGGPSCRVKPIATSDYPTPARRPADSRLCTERLAAVYGLRLPHWQAALETCLDELYGPRNTRTQS
ncbi:dTDP-4-dehydrorhamnose reductase [Brevundimonas sp. LjRoot202]|uniref:dTDP-4-dehydrorhamnose reductase n=1 Tax=Brevundimonas sp. LjRoot202 TaxID=3342281 RepID=UPI003ED0BC6E